MSNAIKKHSQKAIDKNYQLLRKIASFNKTMQQLNNNKHECAGKISV